MEECYKIKGTTGVCVFCGDSRQCRKMRGLQSICMMVEFTVGKYLEGTNKLHLAIMQQLASKGHSIVLVSPDWDRATEEQKKIWEEVCEVHLFRLPFLSNPLIRILGYVANCLFLPYKFDVIYGAYTPAPAMAAILCGIVKGAKKKVGVPEPASLLKIKKSFVLRTIFSFADGVWIHTETAKKLLVEGD